MMKKEGVFSGYKLIAAASTHHLGGIRKQGETRVYIVTRAGDIQTQTIPYYAESIAFSMDADNNFYVATANYLADPKSSFVEVYKRTAFQPNSWDLVRTLNHASLDATDDYDFCPGQLHFDPQDPKLLHILSHCALKNNTVTRDKIYS
jgi:hypothetical protein